MGKIKIGFIAKITTPDGKEILSTNSSREKYKSAYLITVNERHLLRAERVAEFIQLDSFSYPVRKFRLSSCAVLLFLFIFWSV